MAGYSLYDKSNASCAHLVRVVHMLDACYTRGSALVAIMGSAKCSKATVGRPSYVVQVHTSDSTTAPSMPRNVAMHNVAVGSPMLSQTTAMERPPVGHPFLWKKPGSWLVG